MTLRVNLLGRFSAQVGGTEVRFAYDKMRALLAYIATEGKAPIPRSRLAGLLWPDQSEREAESSLRQALSRLRRLIGAREAPQAFLIIERETIQVSPSSQAEIDLFELQAALDSAAHHRHRHPKACPVCADNLRKAADLYRGDFLSDLSIPDSDLFEDWALVWRESLLRLAVSAFSDLLAWNMRVGDDVGARKTVARLLQVDPWNEPAHASLLRLLAREGQRTEAIQHYHLIAGRLKDELGILPSPELAAEAERLLKDESPFSPEADRQVIAGMPVPVDAMVGRNGELAHLRDMLNDPDQRLITIAGPGGSGKTRLAIAAVQTDAICFDNSAVFVRLDAVTPEWHLDAARRVLGKDTLLVLDGFDHVMKDRYRVQTLLSDNPKVVALVTSRAPLALPGEAVLRLQGLETPPPGSEGTGEGFGAVDLFLRSARRVSDGFRATSTDLGFICDICRSVGGLPLAINLAAAWVATLSCAEIAAEIHQGLDILVPPGAPEELAPGIRSVFDASLLLLTGSERLAFPRLSVFSGGFDRDAAAKVADAPMTILAGLVTKSFVHRSAEGRYYLHDLLRLYGEELLRAKGTEEETRRLHADYYLHAAESKELDAGAAGSFAFFHWLVTEQPNFHAALEWTRRHDPGAADRLVALARLDLHGGGVHQSAWLTHVQKNTPGAR
jgi:DNA-binding SARP family transcriptional activator/predicted ATPase